MKKRSLGRLFWETIDFWRFLGSQGGPKNHPKGCPTIECDHSWAPSCAILVISTLFSRFWLHFGLILGSSGAYFRPILNVFASFGKVVGVLGCWDVGLLGCWVVGLLGCWVVGLLVCWFVGLLVCWLLHGNTERKQHVKTARQQDSMTKIQQRNNLTIQQPIDVARRNARSD